MLEPQRECALTNIATNERPPACSPLPGTRALFLTVPTPASTPRAATPFRFPPCFPTLSLLCALNFFGLDTIRLHFLSVESKQTELE